MKSRAVWIGAVVMLGCGDGDAPGGKEGIDAGNAMDAARALSDGGGALDAAPPVDAAHAEPDAQRDALDAGNADSATPTGPDYGNPSIQPDSDTRKVTDCTGKPDLTLCDLRTTPDRWYDVCVGGECVSPGCGSTACATSGPHFLIPPTAHHTFLSKQDGAEPVTVDLITGLQWQSCAAGFSGADCTLGSVLGVDIADALAYCDALTWAGHDDWYLPDIYELLSIVDLAPDTTGVGSLDEGPFPNLRPALDAYWSTTYHDGDWMMLYTGKDSAGFGLINATWFPNDPNSVRCVRRGSSTAMPAGARFTSDGSASEPVIRDAVTKLRWQGNLSPALTGAQVDDYCDALRYGSLADWRAPTYKEAQSLFHYTAGHFDSPFDPLISEGYDAGAYLLIAGGGLLDLSDSSATGIGIPSKTYRTHCVRGPIRD